MRTGLRTYLISAVPSLGGRIYDQGAASTETPKPFLIVREVLERPESDWGDLVQVVELWPHAAHTKFSNLDALLDEVIGALHNRSFTDGDETFFAEYLMASDDDLVSPEWQAITRGLRFAIYNLSFLNVETYTPDPVQALAEWTQETFPEVQTDPTQWNPSNDQPGIYWRYKGFDLRMMTSWGCWITGEFRAHVMAPSPAVRIRYIRRLVEALGKTAQIPLTDGSWLYLEQAESDVDQSATTEGQVRLHAFYGVLGDELPNVPLLNFAYLDPCSYVIT